MIDNTRAGQNIIYHRQRMGWTQGELAGRLNVTHQAVSKWENGAALPDIATLLSLSRLFSVSMEDLLTGDPAVQHPSESAEAGSIPSAEIHAAKSASPGRESGFIGEGIGRALESIGEEIGQEIELEFELLEQELERDLERDLEQRLEQDLVRDLERDLERNLERAFAAPSAPSEDPYHISSWSDIIALAPFASRETLERLVSECEATCDMKKLHALAPFISHETLDRLIRASLDSADWKSIRSLAPFASRQTLDMLIEHCQEECDMCSIRALAPFVSHETLDRLIRASLDSADWKSIRSLAPFASRQTLDMLIEHCQEECDMHNIRALAPFVSHETLDRLIRASLDSADWKSIRSLAPFASRQTLDMLIEHCKEEFNAKDLRALAPFLSQQTLDRLILVRMTSAANIPNSSSRISQAASHDPEPIVSPQEQAGRPVAPTAEQLPDLSDTAQKTASDALEAFSPFLRQYLPNDTLEQLKQSAAASVDARRTEIVDTPSADGLSDFADRTISRLCASCDAADPIVGRFEEIRSALIAQDYAVLNEFSDLLDSCIGPQWLEEYAALCAIEPSPAFEEQLSLALAQRSWGWIEDHMHRIHDPEIIRRIVLASSSEGFFEFLSFFIDTLDQDTIDQAARQLVLLGDADDLLPFADRISPGILD